MRKPIARLLVLTMMVGFASGAVAPDPPDAAAQPGGTVRAADPTLVRDGNRWISLATNERTGTPNARPCNPDDPVWDKGFAYIPYREGPAPNQLADCWAGDAFPGGPPSAWATTPWVQLQWAPSMANIGGVWWLFYATQRKGTGQQCIGVAASNTATGGNWLHQSTPLICPSGGRWAIDPEIFYDRNTRAWYLLWRQDPGPCDSYIHISRFDPATGRLAGATRRLLTGSRTELGFDEIPGATSCPGGVHHLIENPTMVRADSGELWLFFSANSWDSANYATGWALCGTGSPVSGAECALVNGLPGASRNSPIWGSSTRTAPTAGDPKPYEPFPDLPGFGGLSLATHNPVSGSVQPVYATGHIYAGGSSRLRTQVVFRLDTSGIVPHLVEPEPYQPPPAAPAAPATVALGRLEQPDRGHPDFVRDGGMTGPVGARLLWLFGDAISPHFGLVDNSAAVGPALPVQSGTNLTQTNEQTDADGDPVPFIPMTAAERNPPAGDRFALWAGNRLIPVGDGSGDAWVFFHKLQIPWDADAHDWWTSTGVARVHAPDATHPYPYVTRDNPVACNPTCLFTVNVDPYQFNSSALVSGEYLYLGAGPADGYSNPVRTARADFSDLENLLTNHGGPGDTATAARIKALFRYWDGTSTTNPAAWVPEARRAAPSPTFADAWAGHYSISWNPYLRAYLASYISWDRGLFKLRVAPTPVGPFSEPVVAYDTRAACPEKPNELNLYSGWEHPSLATDGGRSVVLSYWCGKRADGTPAGVYLLRTTFH